MAEQFSGPQHEAPVVLRPTISTETRNLIDEAIGQKATEEFLVNEFGQEVMEIYYSALPYLEYEGGDDAA